MHWPIPEFKNKEAYQDPKNPEYRLSCWKVLCRLKREGKALRIGVSNFTVNHMQHIFDNSAEKPFANQIEYHPLIDQSQIQTFCEKNGIVVVGYSSLGHV